MNWPSLDKLIEVCRSSTHPDAAQIAANLNELNQISETCHVIPDLSATSPTWLDRCALAAMQGLLGGLGEDRKQHLWEARNIAETAYRVADALLAEKRRREGVAS